uniref:hypothetical protein n=1 Tax=Vibrio parahaemolyticus TaxID=670 RepID=UPI002D1FAF9B
TNTTASNLSEKASGRLPDDLTKTQGTTKRGTTRKGDFAQGIISKTHSAYNALLRGEQRSTKAAANHLNH